MRQAKHGDMLELVKMGREFADAIGQDFDRDVFANTVDSLIAAEQGCVLISEYGMLGGVLAKSYFNQDHIAEEIWMWIDPAQRGNGFGRRLIGEFEAWGISVGANKVILQTNQAIAPRKTGKIYQGLGYRPEGHFYIKDL